jgi:hypothetical protein
VPAGAHQQAKDRPFTAYFGEGAAVRTVDDLLRPPGGWFSGTSTMHKMPWIAAIPGHGRQDQLAGRRLGCAIDRAVAGHHRSHLLGAFPGGLTGRRPTRLR